MKMRSLAVAALVVLVAGAAPADIAVVAAGGDHPPDGNGTFFDFDIPTMNQSGHVTFVATLNGTSGGANDNTGIFQGSGIAGSLNEIVRRGDPAPDGNGNFATLDANSTPVINDLGQVAFIAGLFGTFGGGTDNTGIFRGDGTAGGLTQIVRQGQALPGTGSLPNFRGGGVSPFSFNEMEQVAFGVVGFGIFRSSGSGLTQIARSLQPVPGGTGTFTLLSAAALNDAGQVAFADGILGIFRGDGSTIVHIADAGDPAPDGNGNLGIPFFAPAINNTGAVGFFASLTGTNGSATDNQGLFVGNGDALTTIVRRGQTAPDGNGKFLDLNNEVAINDAGQMAFLATLTATAGGATDNMGLFRGDGGTLKQIVRTGDHAPDGSSINSLGKPALNDAGQVAFLAGLAASGGLGAAHAILLYDDQRGLVQMVRTGAPLLGSRIAINSNLVFQPSVTSNGRKRGGLNEQSEVVFRFDLDDGRRGIAMANTLMSATHTPTPSPVPTFTPTPPLGITPSPTTTCFRRVCPAGTNTPTPPTTPAPTHTPTGCVGDCDGSNAVTVHELIIMVNLDLADAQASACPQGLPNGSTVDIALIVRAVNNALHGCPDSNPGK